MELGNFCMSLAVKDIKASLEFYQNWDSHHLVLVMNPKSGLF